MQNFLLLQAKIHAIGRQKYPELQFKIPAIACNTVIIPRVKSPANCRLDCILQLKIAVNCLLNHEWSRVFCVSVLPRRCRWIYLCLQLNYFRGLFACFSPHVKFPTFTGIATMSKKPSVAPSKLQRNTPLHKNYSCLEKLKLIKRYLKILWLKSTVALKEQTRIPLD